MSLIDSDSDGVPQEIVTQDVLRYQEAAQRAEARRDEDDDDFEAGGKSRKRRRSEAAKPQSPKRSRPVKRTSHKPSISADQLSMTSPALHALDDMLTQATMPLHDDSPRDSTRQGSTYSTPLFLPLDSESPENQRVSGAGENSIAPRLLQIFQTRATSPKKASVPPSSRVATTKPRRQLRPRPSPIRENTPSPTIRSIEATDDDQRQTITSKKLPSPPPASLIFPANNTAANLQALELFKLISDFGTLGVQKLDAAQACKAKEKEISDLLAAHQKELNELSANLQRLENEHGVVLAKLQDNGIKIDGLQKP